MVEGDLPYADDADVLDVGDTFFTTDEVSAWESVDLAVATTRAPPTTKSIPIRVEPVPAASPAPTPPPLRRRFRYYIARPFNGAAVAAAPAARSGMRFTERTAIRDVERASWNRWPEVITVVVGIVIGLWLLFSF